MSETSVSEILCECDAVEAMCDVSSQIGAGPKAMNLSAILQFIAAVRAIAGFISDHPEIKEKVLALIEAIKRMFGPQPTPTPDNGVV